MDTQTKIETTAVHRYGVERAKEMAGAIQRLAEALATVDEFDLPDGVEPLPTAPPASGA